MNLKEFIHLTQNKIIYLDGATGSNLQQKGMPPGVCPETWILEHREVLLELQRAYVEAGSNILYAPTFTSNRIKLSEYGLESEIEHINAELVALSREAADGKAWIAGDVTMTGRQLKPIGDLELEELIDIYKEQIHYLEKAGVDLIVVETMMNLQETRAALIAAKEICDLPVMVTMTFESDGKTLYGTDAQTAAVVLSGLGACAIGVNCSTGPDQMIDLISNMANVTNLPIIAKPNAGLPGIDSKGNTVYNMNPETFTREMENLTKAGATILGGCCGTTPSHIQALVEADYQPILREQGNLRYLSSERKTLSIELNGSFIIVGERINPTGKKKFQEMIRQGDLSMVETFVEEQEKCGAGILDVNMGMSGIDEKEIMLKVLEEVTNLTSLPLAIDSSHVEVMEAALRHYPGRALINSVSLEKIKFENILPMAKKYGAMFILLPLSDEGLPKNLDEKKKIIQIIMNRALELGLTKEDIVVDGLVTTVGANKNAALETLETIRYCRELGLATICGLSNISFGLPERSYINTAFLTMAISNGLTMAIANPNQELLRNSALAVDLLLNKENSDIHYIEAMNEKKASGSSTSDLSKAMNTKGKEDKTSVTASGLQEMSPEEKIYHAVLKGNKKNIIEFTKQALSLGIEPKTVLNDVLMPAINEVGDLFDKGIYFLPQLISGAEAMKASIEYLEPLLLEEGDSKPLATIVIATVEGDIHDIGKNLVALMLKNYGFRVIDLGKDVGKEEILRVAKEEKAQIIALSALMTTTMQQMKQVIKLAKEQEVDAKIIIGGAVITQDYADEIGADGYSKDAQDAVRLVKRVLHITQ